MKKLSLILSVLLAITLNLYSQSNDHALNDPLYRDIVKYHLNVTDQNINDAIIIDRFLITLGSTKQLPSNLDRYTNFDLEAEDLRVLIEEYNTRQSEIDIECDLLREEIRSQLDVQIEQISDLAERELNKAGVNTSSTGAQALKIITNEGAKSLAMSRKETQIREAEIESERKLKESLERILIPKKNEMLQDHKDAMDRYKNALSLSLSLSNEQNYLNKYIFHSCCYDFIIDNYDYKSTDWLSPKCLYESSSSIMSTNIDYLEIALRKYELYKEYKFPELITACNEFLDMAISENVQNVDIHILRSELAESIIDKYFNLKVASRLDSTNKEVVSKLPYVKAFFIKTLGTEIINSNTSFIQNCIDKGLLNISINNLSPIEYAISNDKVEIMNLLIDNGLFADMGYLQVTAITANSINCLKSLVDTYKVDKTLKFSNHDGMTLLNLAAINKRNEIATIYMSDDIIISSLEYSVKHQTKLQLDQLCDYIYDYDITTLREIITFNLSYNPSNYIIDIAVKNNKEAEIYYDKKLIGKEKTSIELRSTDQLKEITIIAKDKYPEFITKDMLEKTLQKGNSTLEVNLINSPRRLIIMENSFLGKKTYNDFYRSPILLKEEKKVGNLNGALFTIGTLASYGVAVAGLTEEVNSPPMFIAGLAGFAGGLTGAIISFSNGKTKPIKTNVKQNNRNIKLARENATSKAKLENQKIFEKLNLVIYNKNNILLSQRNISVINSDGNRIDITPDADETRYSGNITESSDSEANKVKLFLFEGIGEIRNDKSTYSDIIYAYGEPTSEKYGKGDKYLTYEDIGVKFAFIDRSRELSYIKIEKSFKGESAKGIKLGLSKIEVKAIMKKNNFEEDYSSTYYDTWNRSNPHGYLSFTYDSDLLLNGITMY